MREEEQGINVVAARREDREHLRAETLSVSDATHARAE
jgi:hypothetical protein